MDYDFWYMREDVLELARDQVITPNSAKTHYEVREGDPANVGKDYDLDGLADLVAGAVFRERTEVVRLFRAHKPAGSEPRELPYLLANKKSVRVVGATSKEDELLVIQRRVGRKINDLKKVRADATL